MDGDSLEVKIDRLAAEMEAERQRSTNLIATVAKLWRNSRAMLWQIRKAHADECRCVYCTAYIEKAACPSLPDLRDVVI